MLYRSERRNVFANNNWFKLSRSKIESYFQCPRCFYLDRKCGTGQPPSFPFTLNNAVDALLKKEFNKYRATKAIHPLCVKYGIKAIPFAHLELENWRMNQRGIKHQHEESRFCITGAVDDVWLDLQKEELIIVDYKATSSKEEITLDAEYRQAYKRQMEIYQWLFRKNGFKVSNTGYFVYCNGDSGRDDFQGKLMFDITLIPYVGNDDWIEGKLLEIRSCLEQKSIPDGSETCHYCQYWTAVHGHLKKLENQTK